MNQQPVLPYRLLSRILYFFGVVALLAGLGLSLLATPVGAQGPQKDQDLQLNLSHIKCVDGRVEIHFVLLNVPKGVTPGNLTFTYNDGTSTHTVTVSPGSRNGNVWHYYSYRAPGYYNVTAASVSVNGQTVTLHNPGSYAGTYCTPPTQASPSPTTVTPEPTTVTPPPTTETPEPTTVTPSPTTEAPEPTTETPVPTTPTEATVLPPGDTSTPAPSETVVPTTETPVITEEPPVSTETAIVPPTGQDPTATPQPSVAPTLPPPPAPSSGQPGLLIPVTGADQTQSTPPIASFLTFLGMALLGLGLLTQSAARRVEVRR
ncbi:hypothetical protein SE15_06880 [Thermanaerothrix daxensis]|uniref:Uncharacterized protein n=1 Tax=Thermanaerothrix daxensis TaxID=869279 RepID=A0A0P6XJW9_9CHLR|nr:hypothetical protein [Thermanaerothrix daxensis]KPL83397.1 hypothetical protein SE15_06880 [Thermanaerothrix daxensis]